MTSATGQVESHRTDRPQGPAVDRLLRAGARAFAAKGYHATTTRDIASLAGLSPAGVYVHFASKEALLHALCRAGHEAALDLVVRATSKPGSPTERVARLMADFAAWHAEHHEVARVVQYEFSHLTPDHHAEVLRLRRGIDHEVRSVLEEGVASGELAVVDVRDTARALLSLCIDVARWYSGSGPQSPAQIGKAYAAHGLRLVAAGS